jgi:hypothetical protein
MNGGCDVAITTPDYVTWTELKNIGAIAGPLITVIIALLVVTYKSLQTTNEKLAAAQAAHVKEDDDIHDKLFSIMRENDEKLNRLLGAHDARILAEQQAVIISQQHHPNPDNLRLP